MEMIKEFVNIGLRFLQLEIHIGNVSFSYWNIIIFAFVFDLILWFVWRVFG